MEKQCNTCKKFKTLNEFGRDDRTPTGLKSKCLVCESEYNKSWREKNREKFNRYQREYRAIRKEQGSPITRKIDQEARAEYNQKYRDEHKEERAEKMRLARAEKPEHYKEIDRRSYHKNVRARRARGKAAYQSNSEYRKQKSAEYRKQNLDKVLKWNRNRRIMKAKIPGNHTLAQWEILCAFFCGFCPRCAQKRRFTIDHIIPTTHAGSTDYITNIQPLCKSCNSSKNDSDTTGYRPKYTKAWAQGQVNL